MAAIIRCLAKSDPVLFCFFLLDNYHLPVTIFIFDHILPMFCFQALCGAKVEVPTLTKGRLSLPFADVVKPTTTRRIQGQGLPHPKDPSKRGDLIISFDIQFPDKLSESAKQILWDTLPPHN